MTDEERLKKMMDRLNENSYYGIMTDTEITKIVRSHIKRLEDNEMKATSVQNIKNVKDICFSIENDPIERESKLTIVASTNDDIFAFEFEGSDLLQSCKKVGLFTGWENDETIKRKNREINELNQKLYQVERDKERLTDRYKDLEKQYNELSDEHAALRNVKIDQMRSNELLKRRNQQLKENAAKIAKENEELKTKSKDISNDNALLLETNKKLKEENERNKENLNSQHELIRELIQKNFNEKLHNFEVNNKKYDGKIMEEILKRNSGRYSLDDEKSSADNVNHPSHYTGKYECIDVMQDVFGDEATNDFCLCNAFKYIWRARKKNGLEDVKKAVWYLNKYVEEEEKDGEDEVTGT